MFWSLSCFGYYHKIVCYSRIQGKTIIPVRRKGNIFSDNNPYFWKIKKRKCICSDALSLSGGKGGIRTPGTVSRTTV